MSFAFSILAVSVEGCCALSYLFLVIADKTERRESNAVFTHVSATSHTLLFVLFYSREDLSYKSNWK